VNALQLRRRQYSHKETLQRTSIKVQFYVGNNHIAFFEAPKAG